MCKDKGEGFARGNFEGVLRRKEVKFSVGEIPGFGTAALTLVMQVVMMFVPCCLG